jgi:DNA modification methylase
MPINKLILGDNLEILKQLETETVDLIYLDPPFFSNRNYEVIWGDAGEVRSFADRWSGGMDHYIGWLKERVEQMHRIKVVDNDGLDNIELIRLKVNGTVERS